MDTRHRTLQVSLQRMKEATAEIPTSNFHLPTIQKRHNARHEAIQAHVMQPVTITCPRCGKEHQAHSGQGLACSKACRQWMYRNGFRNPRWTGELE